MIQPSSPSKPLPGTDPSSAMAQPASGATDPRSANRKGILWMVIAMTAFMGNDAMIKALGERLPAAQMIVVRGVMAISIITLVAWRMGALPRIRDTLSGWVVARGACEGLGTFIYLAALFNLPLANVTAINLSSPLMLAVLAMIFLGERVTPVRWLIIAVGFTGVLLVIQPSLDGMNTYAWMTLVATLIYACRDLLTRKVRSDIPSILMTLTTASVVWLMAAAVLAWEGWTPIGWRDVGLLGIASVFLSLGYYAIVVALRQGEMSVIAPFRYVGLLWAVLLGWIVWGDLPNLLGWFGIALLIAAGLAMIRTQQFRKH